MQEHRMDVVNLPVTIMRGGTSKGIYILEKDLPADQETWEPLLLALIHISDPSDLHSCFWSPLGKSRQKCRSLPGQCPLK